MSQLFLPVPQGSPEPQLFQVDTYFKLKKINLAQLLSTDVLWEKKMSNKTDLGPDLEWPTQTEHCICSHCFHIFLKDTLHICSAVFTFVWKTPVWLCCQSNGVNLDQIQCKQKLLSQGLCVTVRLANNKTNGKLLTAWLQVDSFLMKKWVKWQIIFVTDVKLFVEHSDIQKASTMSSLSPWFWLLLFKVEKGLDCNCYSLIFLAAVKIEGEKLQIRIRMCWCAAPMWLLLRIWMLMHIWKVGMCYITW